MEQKTDAQKTILIVEDEKNIVDILRFNLQREGYRTVEAYDGADGLEKARKENPDLILLDVMLPGEDGVTLLRRLRARPDTADIPVIMATAKGMEYDKVQSLDLGADDYLVKPFGMMEMVSRVRAVLRRARPAQTGRSLTVGGLTVDTQAHTVIADGERIALTAKEFDLLTLFLSHPGTAYTRDRLFSEVWGSDLIGESRTVDMHIRTLRQKLGSYGELIETVRGVGYRLEVPK